MGPLEKRYAEARNRLDGIIDVTGFGGTIRIQKNDLVAILEHLDAVEADLSTAVAMHALWQARAERAERAINEAMDASDYLPDSIRIWDSATAWDILLAASNHAKGEK